MNYPISQCQAQVSMTLEQIVDIEKAFARVQELEQELQDTKLQLAEAKEDLRVICKPLHITSDISSIWVKWNSLSVQEQEALVFAIKRNQVNENV